MKEQKEKYLTPHIEVIEMQNEGVIAASATSGATGPTFDGGANIGKSSFKYNNASSNDFEDMITNILTFEE